MNLLKSELGSSSHVTVSTKHKCSAVHQDDTHSICSIDGPKILSPEDLRPVERECGKQRVQMERYRHEDCKVSFWLVIAFIFSSFLFCYQAAGFEMLYQENKERSTAQASEKSKVCFSGYT